MERFTLLFRGATVGMLDSDMVDSMLGGNLSPLPGFEALRATISDASRALANHGFLPPAGALSRGVSQGGSEAAGAAFADAQALCEELELRDARGQLVPTDWINVFGGRTADDPITVLATIRQAPSAVPASLAQQRRGGGSGSEPQAG